MANITNLTNSTWEFLHTLNFDETIEIKINFVSNDFEYDTLMYERGTGLIYIKNREATTVYPITDGVGVWINEESRIINITGGEDVTNLKAINYMKGLATYVSGGAVITFETPEALLTHTANAIRSVSGKSDEIQAKSIPNEILSIVSGTIDITENGTYDVSTYASANLNVASGGGSGGGEDKLKVLLDAKKSTAYLFVGCTLLESVDDFIKYEYTENATSMYSMFSGCELLKTIPLLNTSKVTNMGAMFYLCENLTTIPLLNTSNVTIMSNMFYRCKVLTTIPPLDTSNVTNFESMFCFCSNLTTVPALNASKATNMYNTFSSCSKLKSILMYG